MAILRKNKSSNYTVIDNNIFMNTELSIKAKGLLCQMLSLPDDWEYSVKGLATLSNDGVTSITSALNELEEQGYFRRERVYVNGKFSRMEYIISEIPMTENLKSENLKSENLDNIKYLPNKVLNESSTKEIYSDVVNYLNECVGTAYTSRAKKTRSLIDARIKEGATLDDFKTVIYKKTKEWKDDPRMVKYLRPETLFGTKFESYLNQVEVSKSKEGRLDWIDEL